MKHSPLPWDYDITKDKEIVICHGSDIIVFDGECLTKIDAEFICQAVNCHEELMSLLKAYIGKLDDDTLSDERMKNWLDDVWLPKVRSTLKASAE